MFWNRILGTHYSMHITSGGYSALLHHFLPKPINTAFFQYANCQLLMVSNWLSVHVLVISLSPLAFVSTLFLLISGQLPPILRHHKKPGYLMMLAPSQLASLSCQIKHFPVPRWCLPCTCSGMWGANSTICRPTLCAFSFNDCFAAGITTVNNLDTIRSKVEPRIHNPIKNWIFAFQGNCNTSYQIWREKLYWNIDVRFEIWKQI